MDYEECDELVLCPKCDGVPVELGQLGQLFYYRCRACGWEYYVGVDEEQGSYVCTGHFKEEDNAS